ncbi:MAG: hypothetical protein ACRCW9_06185 [Cetobacterium sp.]
MSKAKNCKFIWFKSGNEILTPYRSNKEIGSLGGREKKRLPGHDPIKHGLINLPDFIKSKLDSKETLGINQTPKSIIKSYYLELTKEELNDLKTYLETINDSKEQKNFSEFKITDLNNTDIFETKKFCGTAKEELTALKNLINGECK